ncbi:MAG: dihydroorotase, partial [Sphingopyxis sp.]
MTGGTLFTNARLVNAATWTVDAGQLLVADGRIAAMGAISADAAAGANQVDAGGLLLAPGIIDFGVFSTDRRAFHFGGITRAALM